MVVTAGQLLIFLPAALLVAASPGANNLLALRNGLRSGFRPALFALVGRFTAFTFMLVVVVAGLGALLATSQVLFEVLKWAGALYLVGLGLSVLWRSRGGAANDVTARPADGVAGLPTRLVVQEFVTAAANPKALLLFTAFLPQFTRSEDGSVAVQLAVLGALYIAVEAIAATGWAGAGRLLGARDLGARALQHIDRASGIVFVGLGAGLAASGPTPPRRP